ncbi:MAG: insulinase family protein, partial [Gemmatimonadota bacterium]|nr:insulinase family protein [Gemmatimonadota bacterium]
ASSTFIPHRDPGPFLISTAVQSDAAAPAVREILAEVEAIRAGGATPAELDDTRNYLAGVFPLRLETTSGIVGRLAQIALYELADGYFDRYRDRILAVSADEVLRAAQRYLRPQELSLVIVGDAGVLRAPLDALGLGEVEIFDPASLASR